MVCDEVTEFQSDESFSLKKHGEDDEGEKEKKERTEITMKEHVYLEFHNNIQILLQLIRHLIQFIHEENLSFTKLAKEKKEQGKEVDQQVKSMLVNAIMKLWIALSQVDPRHVIKEQALLESIRIARSYRDMITMDLGTIYACYAILYVM